MDDLISRQAALDIVFDFAEAPHNMYQKIRELPSAEKLTDAEQRIFLAAMGRERKLCKELPRNDWLLQICDAIERKVKSTLWTN